MKKTETKAPATSKSTAADNLDARIAALADWRATLLTELRDVIETASPALTLEWKWDSPVWTLNGTVVSIGAFKDHVKVNFFKGALLEDPKRLFNAGLDAKTSRGIDIAQGGKIDKPALKALIKAAVALQAGKPGKK
jgi:hypothetical protein